MKAPPTNLGSRANPRASTREKGRAFEQCSCELRAPGWLVTLSACLVHVVLLGAAWYLSSPSRSLAAKPPAQELFEVELAPPAPPVSAPEPERAPEPEPVKLKVVKAAPAPAPAPDAPEPEKPAEPEPPAAAAAEAAQALTQTETAPSDAPADTLVTGQGAAYAGGTTERGGTAKQAVAAQAARAFGVEGATGTAAPDRSRPAHLASGLSWDCHFPEEAQEEGLEHPTVGLMVEIDTGGKVINVEVTRDPGFGLGREARSCAMRKRWTAALDRNGQPVRAKTPINVRFEYAP